MATGPAETALKRYADDFVVMCRSRTQAKEALALVQSHLNDELKLNLTPEKTHIATFSEGFAYLGFDFDGWDY